MKFSEMTQKRYRVFVDDSNLTRQKSLKTAKNMGKQSLYLQLRFLFIKKTKPPDRGFVWKI